MQYQMTLDYDQATDMVVKFLEDSIKTLEKVGSVDQVPTWDALNQTLAYFMTPSQLREYEANYTPYPGWVDIVIAHDDQKVRDEMTKGMNQIQSMFPGIKGVGFVL